MKMDMNPFTHKIYAFVNNTDRNIRSGLVGYVDADDRHSHGYYMIGFLYFPYNVQENKTIDRQVIESGKFLVNVM